MFFWLFWGVAKDEGPVHKIVEAKEKNKGDGAKILLYLTRSFKTDVDGRDARKRCILDRRN
jgi:hypothetical protein